MNDERLILRENQLPARVRLIRIEDQAELNTEMTGTEAWAKSQQTQLDLILVAPRAEPPVFRLADWGKFRFAEEKAEREQARLNRAHTRSLKELRINQQIGPADYQRYLGRIREWLPRHDVRIEVVMRGFRGSANRKSLPRGMDQQDAPQWPEFILNRVIRDLPEASPGRISIGQQGIGVILRPV